MTMLSRIDALDNLLASVNDASPATFDAATRSLELLRKDVQHASNWRRAELLKIVCALAAGDKPPSADRVDKIDAGKLEEWSRAKIVVAKSLLGALDDATIEEYGA